MHDQNDRRLQIKSRLEGGIMLTGMRECEVGWETLGKVNGRGARLTKAYRDGTKTDV